MTDTFYEYQNNYHKINTINLIILNFVIRRKQSIIQCDKYIFQYGFETDYYPLD